ncbi:MAG TPA: hypothetical protein VG077_15625 [Verrucomicrobiae bacterium]|nr:hypothetical protein [Verrucomicrobiae bacterium]
MKLMKRLCIVTAILSLGAWAGAHTFTVLKTFNSRINVTGQHSVGTLAQGADGTLYGVTTDGGPAGRASCSASRPMAPHSPSSKVFRW